MVLRYTPNRAFMRVPVRVMLLTMALVAIPGRAPAASLISMTPAFTLTDPTPREQFGMSVGGGDVNSDGVPDIIVGAPYAGGTVGKVYVYSGRDGALLYSLDNGGTGGLFGNAVGGADVDGDGVADVIAGALGVNPGGRVYVFSGALLSVGPPEAALRYVIDSPVAGAHFGRVLAAEDFTHDGHADILIAASGADKAYVYSGARLSGSGPQPQALLFSFDAERPGDGFASCLGPVSDVDGDGTPDILIGEDSSGIAWVFSGADGRLLHRFPAAGEMGRTTWYGRSLAGADFTGDGRADPVVGAPYVTTETCQNPSPWDGCTRTGRVYVYSGADGALLWSLDGLGANGFFGFVSAPGDLDGDGTPDLLATAPNERGGTAYVLSGARLGMGLAEALLFSFMGREVGDESSRFVGDLNRDGVPDLVAGARGDNQVLVFLSPPPPPPPVKSTTQDQDKQDQDKKDVTPSGGTPQARPPTDPPPSTSTPLPGADASGRPTVVTPRAAPPAMGCGAAGRLTEPLTGPRGVWGPLVSLVVLFLPLLTQKGWRTVLTVRVAR